MDQDGSGKEHWEKGGTKSRDGHPMELTFLQVSLRRKNWKSYSQSLVWSVPQVGMTKNRKEFSDGAKKNVLCYKPDIFIQSFTILPFC